MTTSMDSLLPCLTSTCAKNHERQRVAVDGGNVQHVLHAEPPAHAPTTCCPA